MKMRNTAMALLVSGLMSSPVVAQTQTTDRPVRMPDGQAPVYRVTVVGRTTAAVNYRPRAGQTRIDFAGTPLMPQAKGQARVQGKDGVIEINASFDKLPAPAQFGPEYMTYVIWAITPEGRATNLGELQVNGNDGDLRFTTELQSFGMIVTAEPYFAVTQPSDVVVMENAVRDDTEGRIQTIQAKYELLKRGTYLMNQSPSALKLKPLEPGVPLDLAEARNAVALAQVAGADIHAADTWQKASQLLASAESAKDHNAKMMQARQAVQTAEDARLIAIQKQEDAATAAERTASLLRESIANQRASAEASARATAERNLTAAETARAQAERDRLAAAAAADAAARDKSAAEAAAAAAARDKNAAEAARQTAELTAQQAEREKQELRDKLRQQLNVILDTRETARGLIVNLSDVLFDTAHHDLKPGAREKVAKVAGILLAYPGLQIEIDGHTDNVGADDYNQRLSERRAESVRNYLVSQGIPPATVTAMGFGEQQPVVSNTTASGRQQNRRVELVVSGEPIAIANR